MAQNKITAVIAYRNDPFLWNTVEALLEGIDSTRLNIIIVDDCSDQELSIDFQKYPNIRLIRNECNSGVGYSFDRGVEASESDDIILMGSDVIVKDPSWIDIVEDYLSDYRESIGCSVCLSLDPDHLDPNNPADNVKRYGASIMPFVTTEELPSDSSLLNTGFYYVGMFDARWCKAIPDKDISEVPCIYGAFYATTKTWYNHIHGWDTIKGKKFKGHTIYGGLEPMISLKKWLYGGECHVIKRLETGHIFHKYRDGGVIMNGRNDAFWFNKMFIAYTMMPEKEANRLIEKVYSLRVQYELYTMQFNVARKLIRQNWDYVRGIRERNIYESIHDFDWFCEKFDVSKNY